MPILLYGNDKLRKNNGIVFLEGNRENAFYLYHLYEDGRKDTLLPF